MKGLLRFLGAEALQDRPGRAGCARIAWSTKHLFGLALASLLVGYAVLGRGFAYLHVPLGIPVYVGEIGLVIGAAWALTSRRFWLGTLGTLPGMFLAAFVLWGVIRTVPYLGRHGTEAVRDAALYYYGAYLFLGYALVREGGGLVALARLYAKLGKWYVFWVPVVFLGLAMAQHSGPLRATAGGDFLLLLNPGDFAVHLAGVVTFFLLVAENIPGLKDPRRTALWYATALLSALLTMSRAAYLAMGCAGAAALFLGASEKLSRLLLAGVLAIMLLLAMNLQAGVRPSREASLGTMASLVQGIISSDDRTAVGQDTKRWRLLWWGKILRETLWGEYFWMGRGFGENLADAHGFQTGSATDTHPLRSPHSVHFTVLARMGVPGLLLWLGLNGTLVLHLMLAWRRARQAGDGLRQGILAWALCFWAATVVHASFGVYLESPQGAIWFWFAMGVGLAAASAVPGGRQNREPLRR
ncbi:MAG TPA: O-antigen ligase family protein [Planctomycetota bacterium]|nr:O-antigen ligase family protein [Planctomycetota bacterium]